jgi:HEPN domain-containing protein
MSQSKNRHEAERWLLTAEEDLAERGLKAAGALINACKKWLEEH